jgi:hypothetical protein
MSRFAAVKLTPRLGEISHWHGRQSSVEVVELSKV